MTHKNKQPNLSHEWSHLIDVARLEDGPLDLEISAPPEARKDLARRVKVDAIDALTARARLEHADQRHVIYVSGRFRAIVQQTCVISDAPITQEIEEDFEGWYADPDAAISLVRARHDRLSQRLDAEVPMLEEADDPEPLIDGKVDLGELVSQYLSLAIDPYPHAEGVSAEEMAPELLRTEEAALRRNPFAALKDWKAGRRTEGKN